MTRCLSPVPDLLLHRVIFHDSLWLPRTTSANDERLALYQRPLSQLPTPLLTAIAGPVASSYVFHTESTSPETLSDLHS